MSEYDEEFQEINPTQQEQFMNINDHTGAKKESNNDSQPDESPFQQLQNIMNQQQNQSARKEIIHATKLNQLQSKCEKLFKTNSYLTKRIELMNIQAQEQKQAQIDLSQLQQFINELQHQFEGYKQELLQFRNKKTSNTQKTLTQIQELVQTIQSQKEQIQLLQGQKAQLIENNNVLARNNRNLETQIEGLERQLGQQRSLKQYSKTKSFTRHHTSAFQDQVQAQLQQLIQKLMGELQFERNCHKKSMNEIKRMQQQIMQLQREIVSKNNKIYQLQMDNLKSQKSSIRNVRQKISEDDRSDRTKYQNNEGYRTKSERNSNSVLKSFTIEQMLSGNVEINQKERFIIASKVISFYLKKIQNNDLVPYNSDKLVISNYNKVNPSLIMIRKLASPPYNGDLSLTKLGWNLGVLLSNLLIEWKDEVSARDQNEQYLQNTIQRLLREKLSEVEEVYSLKSVVDQIIKTF